MNGTDNDLFALLDRLDPATAPALYVCCGTEDPLYPENRRFVQAAADRDVPLVKHFGPGDHDWAYWDAQIQDVLAWLPLSPASQLIQDDPSLNQRAERGLLSL